METGTVKWYNDAKGYGFILSDKDDSSLIAFRKDITTDPKILFEFQKVTFEKVSSDRGQIATNINIIMTRDFKLYDYDCTSLNKQKLHLSTFIGQVILVVNTASGCGLTNQYAGLEKLYQKYKDRGFIVLAYPSNNFGNQEAKSNEELAEFCQIEFGISFPVMEKSVVIGPDKNKFYQKLETITGKSPQWNFHKYLISKIGTTVESYDHFTEPLSNVITTRIEEMLNERT
jgi:glutathione peroxidase